MLSNATTFGQDSVSVLFIGNSYTYVNDMPGVLNSITQGLGDQITFDSQTLGGATLATHAGNAATYAAINSKPWDFVVIQAQSQEPSFSDPQVNGQTLPYAEQIADSVYASKFCTDVMMFMTWGRQNGDPQWPPISTYEGMQTRLRNAYVRMADSVQGSVSPVGMAWWHARENYPSTLLYSPDESHPSYAGTYLAACTFYASLFRKTPVGSTFYGSLNATAAGQMQLSAQIAVLDSLDTWNLRPISEHTQAIFAYNLVDPSVSFQNLSTKATTYAWDFGDLNTSTLENPVHSYTVNGSYTMQLIAESPCDSDTIEYTIQINSADLEDNPSSLISVKQYSGGDVVISGLEGKNRIEVYSITGALVHTKSEFTESSLIDMSKLETGIYIINISGDIQQLSTKISHRKN